MKHRTPSKPTKTVPSPSQKSRGKPTSGNAGGSEKPARTPSAAAASESTLSHLVYAATPSFAMQSSGGGGGGTPPPRTWVIEWDKRVYHKKIDSASSGQLIWIMAAITSDQPQWAPDYKGSSVPINEPKNLAKAGTTPTTVYLLLVTLNTRRWQKAEATNVLFDSNHPYLKQVFRIDVTAATGELNLTQVYAPQWSHQSEGKNIGDGGAIASQLHAYRSNGLAEKGKLVFRYQGSGGWSKLDFIVNDHASYYNPEAPASLHLKYKTITSTVKITDDQRNKDGSPVPIDFEIRSKLK